MKEAFYTVVLLCCIGIAAIVTKPSDAAIKQAVRSTITPSGGAVGDLIGDFLVNDYTIKITDHIFYKEIYTTTGEYVGSAFLTQIIFK